MDMDIDIRYRYRYRYRYRWRDRLPGIISVVALSFMVQLPKGIMQLARLKSLFSNFLRYLERVLIRLRDRWIDG